MALKSHSILFAFLLTLAAAVPIFAASPGTIVGGWKSIDNLNDPTVVKIAKFAVAEHSKLANTSLVFLKVVSGQQQLVAGETYQLVISANDGTSPKQYRAVVYSNLSGNLKLTSFEGVLLVGGYTPIDNLHDRYVVMVAIFAVEEYNQKAKTSLVFQRVVKGEKQVVAGINYRLVISAYIGRAAPRNYSAIVYSRPWEQQLQLTSFKPLLK